MLCQRIMIWKEKFTLSCKMKNWSILKACFWSWERARSRKGGQEERTSVRRENWQNRTYDLAVMSTYWPGRKCAAYRGVPDHTTSKMTLLNSRKRHTVTRNGVINEYVCNDKLIHEYTWLYEGIVWDFECGDFLFWWHSCISENLHFLFRSLSIKMIEKEESVKMKGRK